MGQVRVMNKSPIKAAALRLLALTVATAAPLIAVLSYFPSFGRGGAAGMISGFSLLLLVLVSVPLFKFIAEKLRSASAPVMWLFVFILFFSLSSIARQMTVISLVGFISNLIAAVIFRLADKHGGENGG